MHRQSSRKALSSRSPSILTPRPYVFASGSNAVYSSVDSGRTWAVSTSGFFPWSLAVKHVDLPDDPAGTSAVFAGTNNRGVVRSLDGGGTWSSHPAISEEIRKVAIEGTGGAVWAGSEQAVYVSLNSGDTWDVVTADLGPGHVHGIAFDASNANIVYVAKWNQGVFASVDRGVTWNLSNNGLTDTQIFDLDHDPFNPGILYASTTQGIFQSVDAGANWTLLQGPTLVNELVVSSKLRDHLFAATENNGMYRSRDGGLTWQNITPEGVTAFVSVATTVNVTELVYAGSVDQGLFVSTKSGIEWMTASEFAGTEPEPYIPPPPEPSPSLTITLIDYQNGESVSAGSQARFRAVIRNIGDGVATQVAFEAFWTQLHTFSPNDPMPFTISAAQGSCPAPRQCFFGDLQPGAERTVEFSGSTEVASLTRYRITAVASAENSGDVRKTAEIGASVTIGSSESSAGGGSYGPLFLLLLMSLVAARRCRIAN